MESMITTVVHDLDVVVALDPYEQGIVQRALKIVLALGKIDMGEITDVNDPDHAGTLEMHDRTVALQKRLEDLEQRMLRSNCDYRTAASF